MSTSEQCSMKSFLSSAIILAAGNLLVEAANFTSAMASGYLSSPFPNGTKYTHWRYECLDPKLCKMAANEAVGGAEALSVDVFVEEIVFGSSTKTVIVVRARGDDPKKMFESIADF